SARAAPRRQRSRRPATAAHAPPRDGSARAAPRRQRTRRPATAAPPPRSTGTHAPLFDLF
ncbi:hypothetical protein ACFWHH_04785, partial [Streptomyces massasporeus]